MHWMVIAYKYHTSSSKHHELLQNIASHERLVKIEQLDAQQKPPCFKALRHYMEAVSILERLCELFLI